MKSVEQKEDAQESYKAKDSYKAKESYKAQESYEAHDHIRHKRFVADRPTMYEKQ
jgi:hypothetical protein